MGPIVRILIIGFGAALAGFFTANLIEGPAWEKMLWSLPVVVFSFLLLMYLMPAPHIRERESDHRP